MAKFSGRSGFVGIEMTGPIFEADPVQRKVIKPALYEALEQGLGFARSITPVKTGNLRDGWYVDYKDFSLENTVPYALFIDQGTSSIPPRNLSRRTAARMNTELESKVRARIRELD